MAGCHLEPALGGEFQVLALLHGTAGVRRGQDGPGGAPEDDPQGADVVGVLVGQGQGLDGAEVAPHRLQPLPDLPQGDARVDEQGPLAIRQGMAITLGPG